jgi:hypothetical protein
MDLLSFYCAIALVCGLIALVRAPRVPRYWLLLIIAAVPQCGLVLGIHIPGMVIVSAICVALWGMANTVIAGLPAAAAGMLLNLLAMALHNGRMPIAADLLARLGTQATPGSALLGSKDIVVDASPLIWLSDHIVLRAGPLDLIASPGDLIVVIGILWWLLASPEPQRSRDHAVSAPDRRPQAVAPAVSSRG